MLRFLRSGFARWRTLGPREGTRQAILFFTGPARGIVRGGYLRRYPLRARPADVAQALPHGFDRSALLSALPTVEAFEANPDPHGDLIKRAEAILAHRFDLLGSGPVELGARIDWQRDFKSGRRWPVDHISRVPVTYPDNSDIKVPWELSRCQHLPLLAAAWQSSADRRYLDEIGAQLDDWIESNPVEFGATWKCTMDVAIRAANWVATLGLVGDGATSEPWFDRAVGSLLLHGRFIRRHLEYAPTRGNHYLADLAGLLLVATLFRASPEGRGWFDFAVVELIREMNHQVLEDGCDHEASIAYHRLVTEMFICATQAVDAVAPGRLPAAYRERLDRMLAFVSEYERPDGRAPQLGDADDGRFLPLGDYGRGDFTDHRHLFAQARALRRGASGHAAFPNGGYYVMRAGDAYVIVRCGGTGMEGLGGHSHNDQLSFELFAGDRPVVVDPGTYLYTADPDARNMFRSTAFHSTLRIDGREQNPYRPGLLFMLPDRTRSELLRWDPDGDRCVFEGRHHGYNPAIHVRRIELRATDRVLEIRDVVLSPQEHDLEWTFPLPPSGPTPQFRIETDAMELVTEPGWHSPSYGLRERAPFLRGRRRSKAGRDETVLRLHF